MGTQNEQNDLAAKKQFDKVVQEIVYRPTTLDYTSKRWEALEAVAEEKGQNKPKDTLYLWITAFVADLTMFCAGIAFSWTSPVFSKLDGPESPLGMPATAVQKSWIATSMCLGAMVGPLVVGKLADFLGRKKTLIALTMPMLTGFIILAFATNMYFFYFARLLHGLSVGTLMALLPMYTTEITEPHNRGKFGCIVGIFITVGILFPYLVGPYLSIKTFSLCCAIPLVIFLIIFPIYSPETPHYLVWIKESHRAEHVLIKLRHKSVSAVQKELLEITQMIEYDQKNKGGIKDLFCVAGLRKSFIIAGGLVILQQCSGINAVTGYLHTIFEASESTIPPNISTAIIGCIKVATTTVAATAVERLGRKILLLVSSLGCAISLIILGVYFYLKKYNLDLTIVWWLPISCMLLYIVSFNLGLGPITLTVASEVFPSNTKSVALSLTASTCFFAQAAITMCFPIIANAVGLAQCFWLFSSLCLVGLVFVSLVVPETKGKTLAEIQEVLNGKSRQ